MTNSDKTEHPTAPYGADYLILKYGLERSDEGLTHLLKYIDKTSYSSDISSGEKERYTGKLDPELASDLRAFVEAARDVLSADMELFPGASEFAAMDLISSEDAALVYRAVRDVSIVFTRAHPIQFNRKFAALVVSCLMQQWNLMNGKSCRIQFAAFVHDAVARRNSFPKSLLAALIRNETDGLKWPSVDGKVRKSRTASPLRTL